MASADFSIDATPVPAAVSVAYGATVNLAVLNLTGVKTITWRIAGSSNPSLSNPTITPAGSPSGATATFTQVSDPGTGLGASFLIECTVTDSTGASDVAYGVAGTVNASGYIPLASGEQTARHATHGWTAAVNQGMVCQVVDSTGRLRFSADEDETYLQSAGGDADLASPALGLWGRSSSGAGVQRGWEMLVASDGKLVFDKTVDVTTTRHLQLDGTSSSLDVYVTKSDGSVVDDLTVDADSIYIDLDSYLQVDIPSASFTFSSQVLTVSTTNGKFATRLVSNNDEVSIGTLSVKIGGTVYDRSVTVGAADSGGAGYRLLRVAN